MHLLFSSLVWTNSAIRGWNETAWTHFSMVLCCWFMKFMTPT